MLPSTNGQKYTLPYLDNLLGGRVVQSSDEEPQHPPGDELRVGSEPSVDGQLYTEDKLDQHQSVVLPFTLHLHSQCQG